MFGKIKRDQADKLFSEYIIKRDGRCVNCGSIKSLTNSHFFSRRHESTRFDTENCDCLCLSCHIKFEHEKGETNGIYQGSQVILDQEYRAWKKKQLGQKRFDALEVRTHTFKKKDRKFELIRVKQLLTTL